MFKRFITSLVALALGIFALAHPQTAAAASSVPAACERQYCVPSCPGDVNAFCDAKTSPPPCPGGTGTWRVINAQCDATLCGDWQATVTCDFVDP